MYGNDAADLVFATTHYKDKPDIAEWFDKNLELIKCIGKMHLPTPKIGILRSTRATRLGFEEPWNWDMGRGALQGVGRNFAYVEVPDILNGTIDQFPVVMDSGTVILDADEVEGLRRYVERGGIFIAQHHTARHSPEKADAWPLATSLGLKVTPKWMSDESFHRWADAKIAVRQRPVPAAQPARQDDLRQRRLYGLSEQGELRRRRFCPDGQGRCRCPGGGHLGRGRQHGRRRGEAGPGQNHPARHHLLHPHARRQGRLGQ